MNLKKVAEHLKFVCLSLDLWLYYASKVVYDYFGHSLHYRASPPHAISLKTSSVALGVKDTK